MTRPVNTETVELVKRVEGLKLKAYKVNKAGNWTIGYGHESDEKLTVTVDLVITEEKAEELLRWDLAEAAAIVDKYVKVDLNDNQRGALTSFVFNLGGGNFAKSTLLKKLNAGDYASVPAELARWNKDNGKVLPGLVTRRAAEGALFVKGSFATSRNVTAEAKASVTDAVKNVVVSKMSAAGTVGFAGTILSAVSDNQYLSIGIAIAIVVVVIFAGLMIYNEARKN